MDGASRFLFLCLGDENVPDNKNFISHNVPKNINDLIFAERFVVWAVRTWNRALVGDNHLIQIQRKAFAILKISDCEQPFDEGMMIFTLNSVKNLKFYAPECISISTDELGLLMVIGGF